MTDISRHPLLKQAFEVCQEIEKCGASVQLTNAVTKASRLLRALDTYIPAATYDPVEATGTNLRGATGGPEAEAIDLNAADFSDALMWLKEGKRVQRAGWNGKDQWVVLIHPGNAMYTKGGVSAPMQSCLGLKNAQGNMQPGWVPSMGDLMATDWQVYVEQPVSTVPPHQQRVYDELNELQRKHDKLTAFFETETYRSLDVNERGRLKEQSMAMGEYLRILAERVAAF